MRGAFGKPQGTVARVHIGQPIISVRARENSKDSVIEALRRAKFKFPGRQKVTPIGCLNLCSCFYLEEIYGTMSYYIATYFHYR